MAAQPSESKLQLPGCGLPLDYKPPDGKFFRSALFYADMSEGYTFLTLYTIREMNMMRLMNQLTDKVDWNKKVFKEEICSKWRAEALATEGVDMTEKMLDWCIEELRYKAKLFEATGFVAAFNGEVLKSDTIIPNTLREELIASAAPLEDVPEHLKDWHPDSNGLVLDLVHPSLFPLIYGKSRILLEGTTSIDDCIERCGDGAVVPIPPEIKEDISIFDYNGGNPYSQKFQWLPCDVDIYDGHARITSYINNLHPSRYANLYRIIEKIIDLAIPLWDASLTTTEHPPQPRIIYEVVDYDPDPESWPATEGPQREENENDNVFEERRNAWIASIRRVVQPEPGEFKEPKPIGDQDKDEMVNLKKTYAETGLQVIVKLANIHLTPENPEYAGGTWHIEGQANEHICASALYYYSSENVASSKLAFRGHSDFYAVDEIGYAQYDHDWFESVFGCSNDEPAIQELGTVETSQGRLITFCNTLQHQVQPFKLADPTKPGYRKILALFLVDPNIKIISTANIPCQRKDWWREAIYMGLQPQNKVADALPLEIQDKVIDEVDDFPMSLDNAKQLRLELMEERKHFVVQTDSNFNSFSFSLCEH